MKINYWACKWAGDADEVQHGTEEDPDYIWVYPCAHPDNPEGFCHKSNKWSDMKDDCEIGEELA